MKARALPYRTSTTKIGQTCVRPTTVNPSNSDAHASCAPKHSKMMLRRL